VVVGAAATSELATLREVLDECLADAIEPAADVSFDARDEVPRSAWFLRRFLIGSPVNA
jgi:hypothetical protein